MICCVCVCVCVRVCVCVCVCVCVWAAVQRKEDAERLVIQLINQIIKLFCSEFREDEKLFNLAAGQA